MYMSAVLLLCVLSECLDTCKHLSLTQSSTWAVKFSTFSSNLHVLLLQFE